MAGEMILSKCGSQVQDHAWYTAGDAWKAMRTAVRRANGKRDGVAR